MSAELNGKRIAFLVAQEGAGATAGAGASGGGQAP
jgi:hypothetical protein